MSFVPVIFYEQNKTRGIWLASPWQFYVLQGFNSTALYPNPVQRGRVFDVAPVKKNLTFINEVVVEGLVFVASKWTTIKFIPFSHSPIKRRG